MTSTPVRAPVHGGDSDDRRVPWPDGIRCPVVLSFHLDAESIFVDIDAGNAHRPITLSQGTYGPRLGVPRILRLLERHGLRASFFVPGISAERHPYAVEAIVAAGHELCHHGYTHRRPDSLTAQEEEEELLKGRAVLESFSGQPIVGYGSPSWEYSPSTIALLRKHGFTFACDAMDEDIPYYVHVDGQPTELVELAVHWTLDDGPLYWFSLMPPIDFGGPYAEPSRVLALWKSEFDALHGEGSYFHLTLHPFLSGRASRIATLEQLIEYIVARPDATFRTAGEVADMYRSVVTPEQGRAGAWFPAQGTAAPVPVRIEGVPLLG
jgi:peptidoglycan/xylan/chitin deacetylase (PgdA/CDA1 family)